MKAPGYTNYLSDGCGRDSYILVNNGGLSIPKISQPPSTKGYFDCRLSKDVTKMDRSFYGSNCSLGKSPASFYYPPDGTGRDFYITKNNGGLINPYNKSPNHFFQSTLR